MHESEEKLAMLKEAVKLKFMVFSGSKTWEQYSLQARSY